MVGYWGYGAIRNAYCSGGVVEGGFGLCAVEKYIGCQDEGSAGFEYDKNLES